MPDEDKYQLGDLLKITPTGTKIIIDDGTATPGRDYFGNQIWTMRPGNKKEDIQFETELPEVVVGKDKTNLAEVVNKGMNEAGKTGFQIADLALSTAIPMWGIGSGLYHGISSAKDIYNNGLNWDNALETTMGVGFNALHLPKVFPKNFGARIKGAIDYTKYGIKDRIQGYNLYKKYLKGNINNISNQLQDFRFNNGWVTTSDKTGTLFLQPATYTRSEILSSGPTSMRMGFQANPGGRLSRNLVSQGKEALEKLPAGTSISADAHGISIPSRLSKPKGQSNITKTLFEGTEDTNTTLSKMEQKYGEIFDRNPYDMSADAHRFFTLEAQKPGRQLVYSGRSGKWNNAAVSNPQVYKWQEAYESGKLSALDYISNYNNWVKGFGGRPGHLDIYGKPYFYHPTVFITHKKGGKIIEQFKKANKFQSGGNIIEKFKNRNK